MSVVGTVVNENYVSSLPEYSGKLISPKILSKVAWDKFSTNEEDAKTALLKLQEDFGLGVCTLCKFYNASGYTMKLSDHYNQFGHIDAHGYPQVVQNGQWGYFLHVHLSMSAFGSVGAVVYALEDGKHDAVFMWSTPWDASQKRVSYVEVREHGHWKSADWDSMEDQQTSSEHQDDYDHFVSLSSIGDAPSPVATFSVRQV